MAAVRIEPADLAPFVDIDPAKASALIDDALATAAMIAPCILSDDFAHEAAAKAILRGAILRRNEMGSGALTQRQAGPFGESVDTRQSWRGWFTQVEVEQLRRLCSDGNSGAFSIDTVGCGSIHSETCSIRWGAPCSCGADIAGSPIYGDD